MSDVNLIFIEMDPTTSAATNLICLLDTELRKRYPGMPIHGINPIEFRRRGGIFLLGKLVGLAVACGALRPLSRDAGEVKRMFVRKDQRGKGFGGGMLNALEQIAIRRGYQSVRLETGANQPEAI